MDLSVVIPVFNEEKTITRVLEKVFALPVKKEVLVVDDGSDDQTKKTLSQLKKKYNFKLLVHSQNLGKGAAIKSAAAKACGEYLIVQDADLDYEPEQILDLLAAARENQAEVVYGSRFKGTIKKMPPFVWWGNVFLTAWLNVLFNVRLTDVATGFKLFRTALLSEITWEAPGFEYEAEITARILKKGVRIFEIPVNFTAGRFRPRRKKGWRAGWRSIQILWRLRFFS